MREDVFLCVYTVGVAGWPGCNVRVTRSPTHWPRVGGFFDSHASREWGFGVGIVVGIISA